MSTHGELTVGKLKKYLNCFSDDTKVVVGNKCSSEVSLDAHANTYYPPDKEFTVYVVIDHGDNL